MKQLIKKIAVVLSVAFVCAPIGAMAAPVQKLIVKDTTGATDKMVVMDNGYIGVGTSTPSSGLYLKGAYPDNSVRLEGVGTTSAGLLMYLTKAGTALPLAGERLGFIYMGSIYNGSTFMHSAGMQAMTEGAWTQTSAPSAFIFETTPINSVTRTERLRISAGGNVGIGTNAPNQKLEVNGGIRLNTVLTKPLCSSATRGTLWFEQGTTDVLFVCAQAAGVPAWKTITLN